MCVCARTCLCTCASVSHAHRASRWLYSIMSSCRGNISLCVCRLLLRSGHLEECREGEADTNRMKGKDHGEIHKRWRAWGWKKTCLMHPMGLLWPEMRVQFDFLSHCADMLQLINHDVQRLLWSNTKVCAVYIPCLKVNNAYFSEPQIEIVWMNGILKM